MPTILIAVDGSKASDIAVRGIAGWAARRPVDAIHLVNVQPRLSSYIGRFLPPGKARCYGRAQGLRELEGARAILGAAGLAHTIHIYVGEPVETIGQAALHLAADEIVVGIEADGLLDGLLRRHMVGRLIRRSPVPVVVVKAPPPRLSAAGIGERLRPSISA